MKHVETVWLKLHWREEVTRSSLSNYSRRTSFIHFILFVESRSFALSASFDQPKTINWGNWPNFIPKQIKIIVYIGVSAYARGHFRSIFPLRSCAMLKFICTWKCVQGFSRVYGFCLIICWTIEAKKNKRQNLFFPLISKVVFLFFFFFQEFCHSFWQSFVSVEACRKSFAEQNLWQEYVRAT